MKKNTYVKLVLAIGLVACMAFIGIGAYLSDADTMTNEFTVGQISVKLEEPNWNPTLDEDGDGVYDVLQLKPLQVITKDPKIYNDGQNDEYVFMTVTIPKANVKTNGSTTAETIELFTFTANKSEHWEYSMANGGGMVHLYDYDWILIDKVEDDNSATYVYAYYSPWSSSTSAIGNVKPGTSTPALFNTIQFANVDENEYDKLQGLEVVVNAYGIQTSNIKEYTTYLNDNSGIGRNTSNYSTTMDDPTAFEIWEVVKNANPSLTK